MDIEMEQFERDKTIPEMELLVAVLKRAIRDFASGDPALSNDAAAWLTCNTDGGTADRFSFEWICEQLGIRCGDLLKEVKDKGRIRSRIKQIAELN